ncbi:MAG: mechanosensitive ion channel family protein [Actinobacteria bacterium]|nr:mechanosensitive ion channel family protein [Actinomycetota bacterium]
MFEQILHYIQSENVLKVALSIIIAALAYLGIKRLFTSYINRYFKGAISDRRIKQRVNTIEKLFFSVVKLLLLLWLIFTLLDIFGLDIKTLVLSAGIAGLALSFGAQSLVKDLIGGFLILIEGQLDLGDFVIIGDSKGIVFNISSRFITLLDASGALIQVPFGSITTIVNFRHRQEEGLNEKEMTLVSKIQKKATKEGILFRYSRIESDQKKELALFFYGTTLRKEFINSVEKTLIDEGFECKTIIQGSSACLLIESKEENQVQSK